VLTLSTRYKKGGELCSYQIFADQATRLILQPDRENSNVDICCDCCSWLRP